MKKLNEIEMIEVNGGGFTDLPLPPITVSDAYISAILAQLKPAPVHYAD